MKLDQQQQAQHLYFQTDLGKTEIADQIGVSRRSLHYWVKQNQWDRIKQNAEHIPSVLAENCYQLMGGLMNEILSPRREGKPITPREASAIYKLTLTINKLKNRGTINENMELFTWLLDSISAKDPSLAEEVAPYVRSHISARTRNAYNHYDQAMSVRATSLSSEEGEDLRKEQELDALDEYIWAQQELANQPAAQPASKPEPLPKQTQSPASCAASPSQKPALSNVEVERAGVRPSAQYVNPNQPGVPQQLHNSNLKQTAAPANPVRQPVAA